MYWWKNLNYIKVFMKNRFRNKYVCIISITNINLSEYIWVKALNQGLPSNIILRESIGIVSVIGYFTIFPFILSRTLLKPMFEAYGPVRFGTLMFFGLSMLGLPIKMYLRWTKGLHG